VHQVGYLTEKNSKLISTRRILILLFMRLGVHTFRYSGSLEWNVFDFLFWTLLEPVILMPGVRLGKNYICAVFSVVPFKLIFWLLSFQHRVIQSEASRKFVIDTHTQFPLNSSNFSYALFWPLVILTVLKISCHLNTNVGEKSMVLNALYQWKSDVINVSLYNQYPWVSKNKQMLKM
jgi:hypothetical protein